MEDRCQLGISEESGLTNPSLDQIPLKRQMLKAAKEAIVLADHSKFERTYTSLIAPLSTANSIVADDGIAPALVSKIVNSGPNVLVAPGVGQ